MKRNAIYLFLPALALALASAGLVVSAQNSNSSMTMTNANSNSAPRKPKPRRPKPKPKPKPTVVDEAVDAGDEMTPRRTGGCDPLKQEPTDLSGTYVGKLKHGDGPAIDATLTINGNNFTMATGPNSHSGRITAVTTCGYTAVTVMTGDMTAPQPGPNPPPPNKAVSLRAKKVGNSLTLISVAGEPEQVMFTSGGGSMRPRRHRTKASAVAKPSPTPQQ
ncbi:MAG TPA: hypothetical protein VJT71_17270 [Pyrinomonadaceae bacterium]|nr:hypothetical protein [Pyrinomonadaceae bacterium]